MDLIVQGHEAYCYTGGRAFDRTLPTLVFIHGAEHDHSVWALQSRYFAHHGRGVLAVDLPAHGRSKGAPTTSIEDMADWLAAFLDTCAVERAALIGHSMGSLIALECAARAPERITRIALLGSNAPMSVSPELLAATHSDEARAQDMINIWSHAAYAHYPSNPGPGFWVLAQNLRLMQRQKPGVLYADFDACNRYVAGLQSAAKVSCPVLLLLAKRDAMTPARAGRAFAAAFAGAQVVEIAGSGHAMMAEKPDEVLEALRAFV